MTTLTQRIVDLAYAGNPPSEVANIMGTDENTVRAALQNLSNSPTSQSSTPVVTTPTVVSGTAQQVATGASSMLYVAITPHSGGTVAVAIGPDATVADAVLPAEDATLARNVVFRVPAGWYFKVTVAGAAAIASAVQVQG